MSMVFSQQEYWSWLPCLLQGIFPTQGLNLRLLQAGRYFTAEPLGNLPVLRYALSTMKTKSWFSKLVSSLSKSLDSLQRLSESYSVMSDSLRLHGLYSPWNSPGKNILEWVAITFSRGSSQLRDQTPVSGIAGRSFTIWATRKTHTRVSRWQNLVPSSTLAARESGNVVVRCLESVILKGEKNNM